MKTKGKKVYVGLSGGVDSSVTAALLVQAGYDVTGVFIKVWEPPQEKFRRVCTWRDDRRDAMRVAANLGLRFVTLDLSEEYKRGVVDYMLAEYAAGRTPNPDVMCNKKIKFGAFYDWAMSQGADFIATGHYARIKREAPNHKIQITNKSQAPILKLQTGKDENKDQSYFLWNLKQEQLAHVLFPVGGYEKDEVRKMAKKYQLPTAEKKDSQGLCFMGKLDVKEFLKEFIQAKSGEVLDVDGRAIGRHDGALFYTLGERLGFESILKTPHDRPYYVLAKDADKNTLTVSPDAVAGPALSDKTDLVKTNWIAGEPVPGQTYSCRIRYRQSLFPCMLAEIGARCQAKFDKPQSAVTSGQSLVAYDGDTCLGGGIII